jgi:hypothetical protein
MLNDYKVLKFVKDQLAFSWSFIELTDEQILEWIKEYTLKEFSQFFPDLNTIGYNPNLARNKVAGKANEYYIEDPEGLEILGIKDIYWPQGDYLLHGHPPLGPLSLGELANWALSVEVSMWVKQFSSFDHTFEFKHPNIVRISPVIDNMDFIAIEYERCQPPDFRKVRNDLQHWFLELSLADIMIMIGRIRNRYGDMLKTPFGEIPLQANQLYDEGKEKKRELLEKLTVGSLPNVVLDFG